MRTAIGVDHWPLTTISHRLDGRIQHGIDEFSIWSRADRSAHNETVEAVDHRRQIHLAGRDPEWSKRQGVVELSP